MDFAFVLDPLPLLKAYKDTSVAMMRALAARGHRVYALEQSVISWRDGATRARVRPLTLHGDDHAFECAVAQFLFGISFGDLMTLIRAIRDRGVRYCSDLGRGSRRVEHHDVIARDGMGAVTEQWSQTC